MRRLVLLPIAIAVPTVSIACSQPNPAFNDCEPPAQCMDDDTSDTRLTQGDGDGDGDGDPNTGDGDADTGPNDTGTTAPETGDGDGDPNALPACPETVEVVLPIAQDTFLDGSYADGGGCVIDWNYDVDMPYPAAQSPCGGLDFGAAPVHWACGHNSDGSCNSTWLGQFAVGGWEDQVPFVKAAHFEVTAKIKNGEPSLVSIYELDVDPAEFGDCGTWSAGQGHGVPPEMCVTTFMHAAADHFWTNAGAAAIDPNQKPTIAATNAPISPEHAYHTLALPVDKALVQGWIRGDVAHPGVLLTSQAWLPTEFNLLAQGSMSPPELIVELCSMAP